MCTAHYSPVVPTPHHPKYKTRILYFLSSLKELFMHAYRLCSLRRRRRVDDKHLICACVTPVATKYHTFKFHNLRHKIIIFYTRVAAAAALIYVNVRKKNSLHCMRRSSQNTARARTRVQKTFSNKAQPFCDLVSAAAHNVCRNKKKIVRI